MKHTNLYNEIYTEERSWSFTEYFSLAALIIATLYFFIFHGFIKPASAQVVEPTADEVSIPAPEPTPSFTGDVDEATKIDADISPVGGHNAPEPEETERHHSGGGSVKCTAENLAKYAR